VEGENVYIKRTYPPTVLSLFLFSLHSYLFIYLNKYFTYILTSVCVLVLVTVPGPVLVLAPSCHCPLCPVPLLPSPGPPLASKHGSSSVVARHSFGDLTLKLSGVRATVCEFRQQVQSPQVLCPILRHDCRYSHGGPMIIGEFPIVMQWSLISSLWPLITIVTMASCVTGPPSNSRPSTARTFRRTNFFVRGNPCCSVNLQSIKFSVAPQSIMAVVLCSFSSRPVILTRKIIFSFLPYGPMLEILSVGPAVVELVGDGYPRNPPLAFIPGGLLFPTSP
jgi:hypothetical protein